MLHWSHCTCGQRVFQHHFLRWWCWPTICVCFSRWISQTGQITGSKLKRFDWRISSWLGKSSEQPEVWSWSFLKNIRIEKCMNKASPKRFWNRVSPCYLYLSRAWKSRSQYPLFNGSRKMNQYWGNDAKIKGIQPQSSLWMGENVGKNISGVEFRSNTSSISTIRFMNLTHKDIKYNI